MEAGDLTLDEGAVPTEPSMALQVTVALQGSPLCLFSTLYPRSDPCSRRGTAVSRVSPRETHLSLTPLSCRLVSENRAGATARTTATTVTKRYRPARAPFWSCARRAAHAGLCCGGLPCSAEPTCQHACMHRASACNPSATRSVHSLIPTWACTPYRRQLPVRRRYKLYMRTRRA